MRKPRCDKIAKGISAAAPQNGTGGKQRPKAADAEADAGGVQPDAEGRRWQKGQENPERDAGEGQSGIGRWQSTATGVVIHRPHGAQENNGNDETCEDQRDHADSQHLVRQADAFEDGEKAKTKGKGRDGEAESAIDPRAIDLGIWVILLIHAKIQRLIVMLARRYVRAENGAVSAVPTET